MSLTALEQKQLHLLSSKHRVVLTKSNLVGCFYCEEIYSPLQIVEWVDEDNTALCPKCGIDSVVPDSCSPNFGKELLVNMHKYWF
jgi:hypothetical protein